MLIVSKHLFSDTDINQAMQVFFPKLLLGHHRSWNEHSTDFIVALQWKHCIGKRK